MRVLTNDPLCKEIPLKQVNVEIEVICHLANITIIQYFENNYDKPLEAMYTFPTPKSACVHSFEAFHDGNTIKAVLEEKEAAQKKYLENKEKGNGTFLLNRVEGDVFECALGNILPNKQVKIITKFLIELSTEMDSTKLKLIFPLTIMPRYTPIGNMDIDSQMQDSAINPPKVLFKPYEILINGKISMETELVSIETNPNKNRFKSIDKNTMEFTILNLDNLDHDISMLITREKPLTSAICEKMISGNPIFTHCTAINIVPNFENIKIPNVNDIHYCIVLDSSGSMEGEPMDHCKKAAKAFVLSLPIGSTFDIYHFGSNFHKFSNESKNILERKQAAINWINDIHSNGGTEMLPVLKDAYQNFMEKVGVIVMLTDGEISNVDEVINLVSRNPNVSIFSIGIGSSVSQQLVNSLAEISRGKAEFVSSDGDKIQEIVNSQLKNSQQRLRKSNKNNQLKVETKGNYMLVGNKIPILYENDNNIFYIFSEKEITRLTYIQSFEDSKLEIDVPIKLLNNENNILHKIAGVKYMDFLNYCETNIKEIDTTNKTFLDTIYNVLHKFTGSTHVEDKETIKNFKNEIISTSLNLNILSKYTSFIGIESRENMAFTTGETITRRIPLQTKSFSSFQDSNAFSIRSMSMSMPKGAMSMPMSMSMQESAMLCDDEEDCTEESNEIFIPKKQKRSLSTKGKKEKLTKDVKQITIKLEMDIKLENYVKMDTFLTSTSNTMFPKSDLQENDIIRLILEGNNNGIYKIINIGSTNTPWLLEKIGD